MKVETQYGFIFEHGAVLDRWKGDYNNLLNVSLSDDFDAAHWILNMEVTYFCNKTVNPQTRSESPYNK